MPTITIRLKPDEKADLESAARQAGQSLSDYLRSAWRIREEDIPARVECLEKQVRVLTRAARGYPPNNRPGSANDAPGPAQERNLPCNEQD